MMFDTLSGFCHVIAVQKQQISTSITNRVWYGFGAPQIKKNLFGPLYST